MNTIIPPAVYPPQDIRLKETIDEVCRDIVDYGDNGLNCYRNQEWENAKTSFAFIGPGSDYFCFHLYCLKYTIPYEEETALIQQANPYLTPDEVSTISGLLHELNASGKSIVRTREILFPFLSKKGFAVIQMLFNKFNSETTFTTKLVVLYLINDILAFSKAHFPGILPCLEPYIEIMISELRLYPDCSINRISKLIDLWSKHSIFSTSVITRFENALNGVVIKQKFQRRNKTNSDHSQLPYQFDQQQPVSSTQPQQPSHSLHPSPTSDSALASQSNSFYQPTALPPTPSFTTTWNGHSTHYSTPSFSSMPIPPQPSQSFQPFYPQPQFHPQPFPNQYSSSSVQQPLPPKPMLQMPIAPINLPHQSNQPIGDQINRYPNPLPPLSNPYERPFDPQTVPAGLMSDYYHDQRYFGKTHYLPIQPDIMGYHVKSIRSKEEEHEFDRVIEKLVLAVRDDTILEYKMEKPWKERRKGDDIQQGELIF